MVMGPPYPTGRSAVGGRAPGRSRSARAAPRHAPAGDGEVDLAGANHPEAGPGQLLEVSRVVETLDLIVQQAVLVLEHLGLLFEPIELRPLGQIRSQGNGGGE